LLGINNAKQMTLNLTKLLIAANNEQSNLSISHIKLKDVRMREDPEEESKMQTHSLA